MAVAHPDPRDVFKGRSTVLLSHPEFKLRGQTYHDFSVKHVMTSSGLQYVRFESEGRKINRVFAYGRDALGKVGQFAGLDHRGQDGYWDGLQLPDKWLLTAFENFESLGQSSHIEKEVDDQSGNRHKMKGLE